MVDELVHTFTAKAEKPITFQVDLQAEGAYADEEYLKEALSNLVDNAVKYSKDTIDIQITSCLSGQYIISIPRISLFVLRRQRQRNSKFAIFPFYTLHTDIPSMLPGYILILLLELQGSN